MEIDHVEHDLVLSGLPISEKKGSNFEDIKNVLAPVALCAVTYATLTI
jgi:hypothetical protein